MRCHSQKSFRKKKPDEVFRKSEKAGKGEWEPGRAQTIQAEGPGTKFGKRDEKQKDQKEV